MKLRRFFRPILTRFVLVVAVTGTFSIAGATPQMPPNDADEIAEYVQMDLQSDQQLAGAAITLTVSNQLAVLSGVTSSLAQAERATARAIASHGIDGVVNQIAIRPSSESSIKAAATFKLTEQKLIDSRSVRAICQGSRIILEGTVGTFDERELARALMSEVDGVTAVRNNLIVTFEGIRKDSQIAEQLRYNILRDPLYQGLDLVVTVSDGVAKINGEVGNQAEYDRLVRKSYVTGVMEVVTSGLRVNSDLAIEAVGDKNYTTEQSIAALRTILEADPRTRSARIQPIVIDGAITLQGEVENLDASDAAEIAAYGIPGVISVSNELAVATTGDSKIHAASPPLLTPSH